MSAEPLAVIRHLATLSEPVDMRDLSAALGCHNYPEQLRNVVATLVRNRQVIRHHNADGILRYSLSKAAAPAQAVVAHAPAPVATAAPAAQATAAPVASARPDHSAKSKEMWLYDHVTVAPISAPDLAARSGFPMSTVANLLQRLKLKGLVRKHGQYRGATWSRVAQATTEVPPATKQSQPIVQDKPSATDALRAALADNAAAAEDALETYIRSVADESIYDRLRQCARKAKEALYILDRSATP